ncbi:hypothetical protein LSTR_LSTR007792 [Laodelphax striatellus]|uniref:Uncharacterized protein n=1 Tax=Laodelphax striatellus TaxID=195883 RepID=A0A482WNY7_LAOST|nr:hypothetical protein LSTR_LSTR007792 [Laodelphax striatellus]
MGRFLVILLSFEIYQVLCEQQASINAGENSTTQDIVEGVTTINKSVIGNTEGNSGAIEMVNPDADMGNSGTSILPHLNALVLKISENDIKMSQCTNATLELFYDVYELYIKSTNYMIFIAFRGGQFIVKTIRCFLINPDYGDVCISNMVSSAQQVYIYASPMISEIFELAKLLLNLYQQVDHVCF